MKIVQHRKIFFTLSAILFALSLFSIFTYGFNLGIDFKGGTITEVSFAGERPTKETVEEEMLPLELGGFSVRPSGESNYIIRTRELSLEEGQKLVGVLGSPKVERQNTVGPIAGVELRDKASKAIALTILMIVLFITFAFRKVSQSVFTAKSGTPPKAVASWKYGLATIVALLHDILIPVGVFVFLGRFYGLEIDLLFVSGLLAILGYSVHDTIVVFDRVRENLRLNDEAKKDEEFEITVGKSVAQTFVRSINTSLTLLITLIALYFVGSGATKDFALLLTIGVIVGTYSSIFVASPLLVSFYKLATKVK
ncbi:MAG: protein translocase subunit SecF [Patescibacteria group bacterium]